MAQETLLQLWENHYSNVVV